MTNRHASLRRVARTWLLAAGATAAAAGVCAEASAYSGWNQRARDCSWQEREDSRFFQHIGTFSVPENLLQGEVLSTVTSAEIIDVSKDGKTLVYTDSPAGRLGFIDIRDPKNPKPAGVVELEGEPTSVAVAGQWALVGLNTSEDYLNPSGSLVVVNLWRRAIVRSFELAGQPDSVAVSPDGRYAAIVIENERDEDDNAGLIPQQPAGALQVLSLRGWPSRWSLATVDLTGLAEVAPSDPEPEFVDINSRNLAVVTLQENNHLVVVDLAKKRVVNHFSAGAVELSNVDATEEEVGPQEAGLIKLTESIVRRREPDAVAWVDGDTFVTANEGDYEDENGDEGGSRGFTLFNISGEVEYESGASFEYEVIRAGHYPEGRSANKGNEPEGVEVGMFGGRRLLFVGSERGNAVGVYDVTDGTPEFMQLLPTGIGPEGIKAIPGRNLVAVSAETDGMDDGFEIRSVVTLYDLQKGPASYPQLVSADVNGLPIPWVAISGLSGDASDKDTVWAVSDSFLGQGYMYRINVAEAPAVIEARFAVGDEDGLLDLEGIAARPEGGFWLASEGRNNARPNALVRVTAEGEILSTVELPEALVAEATNSGFEGVAVTGTEAAGDEVLWAVIQRSWGDDESGMVKLGRYEVASGTWTFAHYPLNEVESPNGGWVGLSEITLLPNGKFAIVERDNQLALHARIKRIYTVDPSAVTFVPHGETLPVLTKTLYADVLAELDKHSISVPDKLEGLGLTADGRMFLATDNDGVDENYGETLFFEYDSVVGKH